MKSLYQGVSFSTFKLAQVPLFLEKKLSSLAVAHVVLYDQHGAQSPLLRAHHGAEVGVEYVPPPHGLGGLGLVLYGG